MPLATASPILRIALRITVVLVLALIGQLGGSRVYRVPRQPATGI